MAKDKIIAMANLIARNLAHGHDDPVKAIADHINMFWDPRMRDQLRTALENQPDRFEKTVIDAKPFVHAPKEVSTAN
jgi:formate dehydrogenase subunit delta